MSLIDQIKHTLGRPENHREQDEAIIDLLYLVMLSDKSVKLDEQDFVSEYISSLQSPSGPSFQFYLQSAIPKVRTALENQRNLKKLIVSICERLQEQELRALTLDAVSQLATVDGSVSSEEQTILAEVKQEFGL